MAKDPHLGLLIYRRLGRTRIVIAAACSDPSHHRRLARVERRETITEADAAIEIVQHPAAGNGDYRAVRVQHPSASRCGHALVTAAGRESSTRRRRPATADPQPNPTKVITVRQAVLDIWNDFNRPLEGRVPFMYLDVKGLVTTGLGNLIDSTADAEQLAWQHADGTPASTDEIDAEWERVKGRIDLAPKGGGAFRADAQLFLTDEEIDRVVLLKLGQMETTLKGRADFQAFDDAPARYTPSWA